MTTAAPLIVVRDLREVVSAGYGNATASVRTLDGVSLEIHSGELLLIGSEVAGGAQALCSALAAPRRSLAGDRELQAGVQIRRATISRAARDVIVRTWVQRGAAREPISVHSAARVVYLLRVRSAKVAAHGEGSGNASHGDVSGNALHDAWRDWARTLRATHGAVVLFSSAPDVWRPESRTPAAVHEPDQSTLRGRVRALRMSAGRVVSEHVISAGLTSPAQPYGDSDASPSPSASSRCSKGSTAPSSRGDAERR